MKEDLTLTMATLMAETIGKILKGIVSPAISSRLSFSKVLSCRTFHGIDLCYTLVVQKKLIVLQQS
jgi:hypothetical protein